MNKNFDIIICGGGTIGLCCALALSQRGFCVLVLDKGNSATKVNHDFDGRNIALNNATIRFFEKLGIWEDLKHKAQPINDIIVSDGTVSDGIATESYLHFDAHDIHTDSFGCFVLNPNIHEVLIAKIKNSSAITLHYDTQITDIAYSDNAVQVTDNHHATYHAPLLIAADGKNSFIREFSGIDAIHKDFKQTAIVLAVAHEKPHKGIAQELFLPAGPFAILPLMGNQTSLVWVENHGMAQALLNAPDTVFMYELERRFGDYLGKLDIISQKFSYPLKMQLAKNIIANRTVLIGDAAHIIHPISGQGFNLGVRDIGYLCDIIHNHHYAGLDIGSQIALQEYKNMRQKDIELLGNVTSSLNWLFSNGHVLLQSSRRFGLGIVQKFPNLRNFFAKSASEGSIAKLPSLLE
jgi:2-octaprenyl-6-methoxyphenol hydroxylase